MGQNLDVLLLWEGHSDLGFVGFSQCWDPLKTFFFKKSTVDITFFNHVKHPQG